MTATARRLLVAAPGLADPNFAHTVVFVVEHEPEGALGVVLNRPSEQDVAAHFPAWASIAAPPARVFLGGPVLTDGALVAFGRVAGSRPGDASTGWQPLLGAVGSVDLGTDPADAVPPVEVVRAFAGYAGWGPGQLDGELELGGWIVVDAEPDDLLTAAPAQLWRHVLRRQGGDLAIMANQPPDPSVN